MATEQMKQEYEAYIEQHKTNVGNGFDWLIMNLPELFSEFDSDYIGSVVAQHDASKYDEEEFDAYAEYFYGDSKTKEIEEAFDLAWLHHQNCNKHHWQYWILQKDNGATIPQPMPYEYIIEMICDWWSFSWKSDDLFEIFDWYKSHKSTMKLHKDTQQSVEDILDLMQEKLEAIAAKE